MSDDAPSVSPAAAPSVAIVGLGLIGGSLARDLAAAGWRVTGWDRDPEAVRGALADGVIAEALEARAASAGSGDGSPDGSTGVPRLDGSRTDVVVLAVPVRSAPGLLAELAPELPADAVLTDVGSTKRSILAAAATAGLGPRFVGSHPLAGDHLSGWSASRRWLFAGARVWLCGGEAAGAAAVRRVASLWEAVGARPHPIDAADHDRRMAWLSHLAQAAASALGATLAGAEFRADELGRGGRDSTRLAGSDPALWTDVLLDNADHVVPAIAALRAVLASLEEAVGAGDAERVTELLARSNRWARGS